MRNRLRAGGIAFLAIVVAIAFLVAPTMAVAPTVDAETTATSTTSTLVDGYSANGFEANSTNSTYLEVNFDSPNASVEIVDPDTGEVHASNNSDAMTVVTNDSNSDGTTDEWFTAWDIDHSELATVPMDAGENKSVTVRLINDTWDGNGQDVTELTWYLDNVDDRAVVYAGDEANAGNVSSLDVDTETDEPPFGLSFLGSNSSTTTVEADNVGLGQNASGTTIHVVAANTSGEDPFSEASEGGLLSSIESQDFLATHQLLIESHPHAVFHEEAPASDLADGYTYGETTTINGHDAYNIYVDEDYDGESSLDVTTKANDEYRIDKKFAVKTDAYGGFFAGVTASTAVDTGLTEGV